MPTKIEKSYRTLLFLDGQEDSETAIKVLEANRIQFLRAPISIDYEFPENRMPVLITGQSEWRGLESIQRYVKDVLFFSIEA